MDALLNLLAPPVILGNDSVYMQLSESSFSITQFNNNEKFTLYKNFLLESIKFMEIQEKVSKELAQMSFDESTNLDETLKRIALKYMHPEDFKKTTDQSFKDRIAKNISTSMSAITDDSSILSLFQSKIKSFKNTNLSEYNQLHEYAKKHSLVSTDAQDIEMFDAIFKQIIEDYFDLEY